MSEEILRERPTIEIEGVRYTIRRPGLPDCFKLARILAVVQVHAGQNIEDFYEDVPIMDSQGEPVLDASGEPRTEIKINGVALLFSLAAGIPDTEDDVIEWIGSMLIGPDGKPLTIEQAKDPDTLPLMDMPVLVEKLIELPDIPAFFARTVHASQVARKVFANSSGMSKGRPAGRTASSSKSRTQGSVKSAQRKHDGQGGGNANG